MKPNYSFLEFCNLLRGYRVYKKNGFEIFKYQLYHKGVSVEKLKSKQTQFTLKLR